MHEGVAALQAGPVAYLHSAAADLRRLAARVHEEANRQAVALTAAQASLRDAAARQAALSERLHAGMWLQPLRC